MHRNKLFTLAATLLTLTLLSPTALAVDVNGDGADDPITFSADLDGDGLPDGLVQAGCTALGLAEPALGAVGYYTLRTVFRQASQEMRYLAGVEASLDEGYANVVRVDLRGIQSAADNRPVSGTFKVRHPHDPTGDRSSITLVNGRGRFLNEILVEGADAATLFAPGAPVENIWISGEGQSIEIVNPATNQVVATFTPTNWLLENNCPFVPPPPELD